MIFVYDSSDRRYRKSLPTAKTAAVDWRGTETMTEATVQQSATTAREQIWLNREQVRKEKPVYRALKRAQDIFFSLLALIVLSPLLLIVAIAIVTHVGHFIRKCGIDELPQLWDILVGSMSIVGPRPPLPCEVAEYTDYERQRLYVRPGLTCIWQIQPNRNDVTFDEWMDMDMRYIRDRSFLLDWKLIFGTVWTVFAGTGE